MTIRDLMLACAAYNGDTVVRTDDGRYIMQMRPYAGATTGPEVELVTCTRTLWVTDTGKAAED